MEREPVSYGSTEFLYKVRSKRCPAVINSMIITKVGVESQPIEE